MVNCPRCGTEVQDLVLVSTDYQAQLQGLGEGSTPNEVCRVCYSEIRKKVASASGGVLIAQERAKEHQRLTVWQNRVHLIKQARTNMNMKNFAGAAIAYEKYLKVLEIAFGLKKGQTLTPDLFKEHARTSELTIVASVYWDLLRIYDTNEKYIEKQDVAAKQLAVFIRFTPIYPDIMKRAEVFVKQAKNPAAVKKFLKASAEQRPRCFIATSAFSSPTAWEVQSLRLWRDQSLRKSSLGRKFILFYYAFSPRIVPILEALPFLKAPLRGALRLVIRILFRCSYVRR